MKFDKVIEAIFKVSGYVAMLSLVAVCSSNYNPPMGLTALKWSGSILAITGLVIFASSLRKKMAALAKKVNHELARS